DDRGARSTACGDPGRASRLFTDVGANYNSSRSSPCNGTDNFGSILVTAAAPQPSGQVTASGTSFVLYCANDTLFSGPALSPDGQTIAVEADSDAANSTGSIATIPVGGSVNSAAAQSPLTQVTPPNSGDTLPDFSPD